MKRFFIGSFCLLFLAAACNNKPAAKPDDAKDPAAANLDETAQAKIEELQKLSPYTLDQMKGMLPEQLNGIVRTDAVAHSAMGAPYAKGEYAATDTSSITLSIFDCAGDAGVGIYNTQFLMQLKMNVQDMDAGEYTKTIDFNGDKAVEHEDKEEGSAAFVWLSGKRLLVTLEGNNIGMDALKKAALGLKLK